MRPLSRAWIGLSFAILSVLGAVSSATAEEDRLTIYIDADFTITPAPADAIEAGLRTAFKGTWAEQGIVIVSRDHRTNARRSLDTFRQAWRDPNAIAVIGGMQSPPYFANSDQINANGMPLLLPWSAGGMLTRLSEGEDNWILRLSVDDTKAATKLVAFGSEINCSKASLIHVDNPWGNGNAKRISDALDAEDEGAVSRYPLAFNSGEQSIIEVVKSIDPNEIDCVYLIAGFRLGATVIKALGDFEHPPRVISHWGILGARLTDHIDYEVVQRVSLSILGTCGLNAARRRSKTYDEAVARAREFLGDDFDPELHAAPHGFFHAHDLGVLLRHGIEGARQTEAWNKSADARRAALRDTLYDLNQPIGGILKTYVSPFEPVSAETLDGHEALDGDDLCMTTVDQSGHIASLESE